MNTNPKLHPPAEVSAGELWSWFESGDPVFLLDVREPEERLISVLAGSESVPFAQILEHIERIAAQAKGRKTVVYCRNGVRSLAISEVLAGYGLKNVFSLAGGLNAYASEVDPSLLAY